MGPFGSIFRDSDIIKRSSEVEGVGAEGGAGVVKMADGDSSNSYHPP